MGYCITMDIDVKIPLSKEKEIKKAFKLLESRAGQDGRSYNSGKDPRYSWINPGFSSLSTVEAMFEEWRYTITRDNTHFIIESYDGEKLGDDDKLWKAMESVVDPSSEITVRGEDGEQWKYVFKKNKFEELHGKVSYGDEDDEEEVKPPPKKVTKTEKRDPYTVLGIKKTATKKEINDAFRTLIKKYHPDKFADFGSEFEEIAGIRTKELNESRDICLSKAKE